MDQEQDLLAVKITGRKKGIFEGKVHSITSFNDRGEFDVLPKHANFITIIKDYLILDKGLPSEKNIEVDTGVLRVERDNCDAYLGI
jgi:F0F1-type ATP synthase epsilon subunit